MYMQQSTINNQFAINNCCQQSTINNQQLTINNQQSTINNQQSTTNNQSTINNQSTGGESPNLFARSQRSTRLSPELGPNFTFKSNFLSTTSSSERCSHVPLRVSARALRKSGKISSFACSFSCFCFLLISV